MHALRCKQVEELEAEVESAQRLASRYKSKLSTAQEEASSLEDALTKEKAACARLRQQLSSAELQLQQAQQQQQQVASAAAVAAAAMHQQHHQQHQSLPSQLAGAVEAEAAQAQLRKLQQQVRVLVVCPFHPTLVVQLSTESTSNHPHHGVI